MEYSFIEYLFVYLRCEIINMVVVVLKAATSFAGIDYNERKNEEVWGTERNVYWGLGEKYIKPIDIQKVVQGMSGGSAKRNVYVGLICSYI